MAILPLASIFTPLENAADAFARLCGLDPVVGAGSALAFFLYEFVKVSILILAISWAMGLVRRSLPMARVRRWLTTPVGRALGYPAAAAFGTVTPFCSCSSVPLFIGFIEAGIPVGVTFAFLITSPLVNEIVVALFLASFGWKVAALYTVSGIVLGVLGGLLLSALRAERWLTPFARALHHGAADREAPAANAATAQKQSCCDQTKNVAPNQPCGCAAKPPAAPGGLFAFATHESWGIYRQVLPYLALALLLGAAIHGYLPEGFFASYFRGDVWWHVPVAVVIGLPLYASANATVPILDTLVAKGVPLGTGMALIMSAVGVSLPELVLLKRVLTVRLLAWFTLIVSVGVMLVGFLFNALPTGW